MRNKKDKLGSVRRKLTEMHMQIIRESRAEMEQILKGSVKYDEVSDDGDLADFAFSEALRAAKSARLQTLLKTIQEALTRIDEGIYGICQDCGQEIAVGRLKALPFALRCVDCQEMHETPEYIRQRA